MMTSDWRQKAWISAGVPPAGSPDFPARCFRLAAGRRRNPQPGRLRYRERSSLERDLSGLLAFERGRPRWNAPVAGWEAA